MKYTDVVPGVLMWKSFDFELRFVLYAEYSKIGVEHHSRNTAIIYYVLTDESDICYDLYTSSFTLFPSDNVLY